MKKIVVSSCLGFTPCRYDGKMLKARWPRSLKENVKFLPVCPEAAIGLGIPRNKIRLVKTRHGIRLIQPVSGADFTEKMRRFARSFLKRSGKIDGFILKRKSPSCGIDSVKVYSSLKSRKPVKIKGAGIFASEALKLFPGKRFMNEKNILLTTDN